MSGSGLNAVKALKDQSLEDGISEIHIRAGDLIDQIEIRYRNGTKAVHGGNGGQVQQPFILQPGEKLVRIAVRQGDSLDGCQFHLDSGRSSLWYGGRQGGKPGSFEAKPQGWILDVKRSSSSCGRITGIVQESKAEEVDKPDIKPVAPPGGPAPNQSPKKAATCKFGTECREIFNDAHCQKFTHPPICTSGSTCKDLNDPSHCKAYWHPRKCKFGKACKSLNDPEHCKVFYHPLAEACKFGTMCKYFLCGDQNGDSICKFLHPTPASDVESVWKYQPDGDERLPEDQWKAYPDEFVKKVDALFLEWLAGKVQKPRHQIRYSEKGKGACDCTIDFPLLTCRQVSDQRILPVMRFAGDPPAQTHPATGTKHPYDSRMGKDSSDWLNNDFFWKAFQVAMKNSGHEISKDVDEIFDFKYNLDFRDCRDKLELQRGGLVYEQPNGWKKYAVRVKGNYDNGDNTWLSFDGKPGEWAVAYHGTNFQYVPGIIDTGLQAGGGQAYSSRKDVRTGEIIGKGIYCSPHIEVTLSYAPKATVDGHTVQIVFQCRVRSSAIKRCHDEDKYRGAYWVINNTEDIRPYGVLIKPCS